MKDRLKFDLSLDIETHGKETGYGISLSPLNWAMGWVSDDSGWSLYLGPLTVYKMVELTDSESEPT